MGDAAGSKAARRDSRHVRRCLLLAGAFAVLAAVGLIGWRLLPERQTYYTDADTIRQPSESAQLRDILWQPPQQLPDHINTPRDDYEPRLSADGLTMYFVRGKAGENTDLFRARRTPDGWEAARPLDAVNSPHDDLGPQPAIDGTALYFYSNRPGGTGGYDLWVTRRDDAGWSEPLNLGPQLNSEFDDYSPAISSDGNTLYFASNRPRPGSSSEADPEAWIATLRDARTRHDYDLYVSSHGDRGWGRPTSLAALNTPFNEGSPALSPAGDFLYFSSDRPGGVGGFDLHRSRLLDGAAQPPMNLGPGVNTPAHELDPGLSMGGYELLFSSNQPLAQTDPGSPPDYNIYRTSSREVFVNTETRHAAINWAQFWGMFLPNLLWALLALLLMMLMLWIMRGDLYRRLSLLAKCLLMSLMCHLLMLFLFTIWRVSATLADVVRPSGGIKVALLPPSGADDIAVQLRGELTAVEMPAAAEPVSAARQRTAAQLEHLDAGARLDAERVRLESADRLASHADTRPAALRPSSAMVLPAPPPEASEPPPAQVQTPELTGPVRTTEPEMSARAEELHLQQRPVAHDQPAARPSADRLLMPDPTRVPASVEQSLASAVQRSVAAPRVGATEPAVAVVEPATMPALRLPASPEAVLQHVREPEVQAHAAGDPLAHRAPQLPAPRGLQRSAVVEVTPESSRQVAATSTIAGESLDRMTAEALPVPAPRQGSRLAAAPGDIAAPPMPEPTLPLPPAPRLGSAPENTVQAPRFRNGETLHREVASRGAAGALPPHRVEVNPQPAETPPGRSTTIAALRPGSVGETAATAEPLGLPARGTTPPAHSPVLPIEDIALPAAATPRGVASTTPAERAPQDLGESSAHRPLAAAGLPAEPTRRAIALPPVAAGAPADDVSLARPAKLHHALSAPETIAAEALPGLSAAVPPDVPSLEVAIPTDTAPAPNPFPQRREENRAEMVRRLGGSEHTERAVELALQWLARHQSSDGRWDGARFDARCGRCGGHAEIHADVALTGLSLLCFLGADHTHTREGPYQDNVRRGLQWLRGQQASNGDLRGEESMYSHGIAAIALGEAYGLTGDPELREPVRLAADFIYQARNRRVGGWRYDPGQAGDTSVLGWQVMALQSARVAGIEVPDDAFDVAGSWLERVSRRSGPGLYSYRPGRRHTPSMTAEAMFVQQLIGSPCGPRAMEISADYILEHPPDWESKPNTYFWYYATLALFQHQGEHWERWNSGLTRHLLEQQERTGPRAGSWASTDRWSELAGRVYQTALCTLMLEVYYRYLPLYMQDERAPGSTPQASD